MIGSCAPIRLSYGKTRLEIWGSTMIIVYSLLLRWPLFLWGPYKLWLIHWPFSDAWKRKRQSVRLRDFNACGVKSKHFLRELMKTKFFHVIEPSWRINQNASFTITLPFIKIPLPESYICVCVKYPIISNIDSQNRWCFKACIWYTWYNEKEKNVINLLNVSIGATRTRRLLRSGSLQRSGKNSWTTWLPKP